MLSIVHRLFSKRGIESRNVEITTTRGSMSNPTRSDTDLVGFWLTLLLWLLATFLWIPLKVTLCSINHNVFFVVSLAPLLGCVGTAVFVFPSASSQISFPLARFSFFKFGYVFIQARSLLRTLASLNLFSSSSTVWVLRDPIGSYRILSYRIL